LYPPATGIVGSAVGVGVLVGVALAVGVCVGVFVGVGVWVGVALAVGVCVGVFVLVGVWVGVGVGVGVFVGVGVWVGVRVGVGVLVGHSGMLASDGAGMFSVVVSGPSAANTPDARPTASTITTPSDNAITVLIFRLKNDGVGISHFPYHLRLVFVEAVLSNGSPSVFISAATPDFGRVNSSPV
jgi:hypothetical protein